MLWHVVGLYLLVGLCWVLCSHVLIGRSFETNSSRMVAGVVSGVLFIACTTLLLFGLLSRYGRELYDARESLRRRSARWKNMADSVDGYIFICSRERRVEYMNDRLVEYMGRSLIGESCYKIIHGFDLLSPWGEARGVWDDQIIRRETQSMHDHRWYHTVYTPLRYGEDVVACMCIMQDISSRKLAEKTLRDSEIKNRVILNAIPDLVFQLSRNGTFLNYHASNQFEWPLSSPQDLLGKKLQEVFPPELARKALYHIGRALQSRETQVYDYHLIAPSGDIRYYENRVVVSGPDSVLSISRDITERKRIEARANRLAMAVEQATEAMIITDTSGVIEYVNPAFERITGYGRDESVGRNILRYRSRWAGMDFKRMREILARDGVWRGTLTNRRKDGSRYEAYVVLSPICDAHKKVINYILVSRDVTHEKELEKQFLQAQRMESVGRLAGGIAHDFNNLLTSILGLGELILQELDEHHPMHGDVHQIMNAGQSAAQLTRQLLALGRKQETKFQSIKLNDVVLKIDPLLRRSLGKHINVDTRVTRESTVIEADAGQIEQVLMNLAVNARDAMPDGGDLVIETETVEMTEDDCRTMIDLTAGSYTVLRVKDSGSGMSEEVQQHAFEPFYSTKEESRGSGLGLSTVYGIVQHHRGHIDLVSNAQNGTEFRIYFPRDKQSEPPDDE
jgi:PAS domain S-box-containing protein